MITKAGDNSLLKTILLSSSSTMPMLFAEGTAYGLGQLSKRIADTKTLQRNDFDPIDVLSKSLKMPTNNKITVIPETDTLPSMAIPKGGFTSTNIDSLKHLASPDSDIVIGAKNLATDAHELGHLSGDLIRNP